MYVLCYDTRIDYMTFPPILIYLMYVLIYLSCGDKEKNRHEFTWIKSSILVLSSLTQRGWSVVPTKLAPRCVFFM